MPSYEPSLADLAAASGLEPRTIRSWVAQGLLPPPLTRGPAARYPADSVSRLLAIRTMRDLLGMSLPDIRKELLVASPEQVAAYASRAKSLTQLAQPPVGPPETALDYIASLRANISPPEPGLREAPARPRLARMARHVASDPVAHSPPTGLEAFEHRLQLGGPPAARKARAEEWLRIPITPDLELTVRGPLDAEQQTRLERCADLIRDILLGRQP